MLYFYKSISPHPIENLHKYLTYFFTKLFAEVHPTYDHAHFIHPDFKEIVDEYTVQIDNKLSAIFTAYMALTPDEKLNVRNAYDVNSRIYDVCNMTVTPIKYSGLPAGISGEIEDLYDNLWGDNKILGYVKVLEKCGALSAHFKKFREVNNTSVCPFCGLNSLKPKSGNIRDSYDHYLPESKYPFVAVHFDNLFPMCHECNSQSKSQVDTPYLPNSTTRRPLYFPLDNTIVNHEVNLTINAPTTDLSTITNWTLDITCQPAVNITKKESWESIFKIQVRYKSIIADESKKWFGWLRDKHRRMCQKKGLSYATFYDEARHLYDDCLNMDKGILLKSYQQFILEDPDCEMKLSGTFTL